jgi:1-acyl-sn-glycerol-3-phosphate acyltransferase
MIYLRSIIFQVYFFASICFFALLIALFAWLPYSFRFFFARTWGRSMLWVDRWLCGLRYRFEGLENIPDEASVVLIKHSTVPYPVCRRATDRPLRSVGSGNQ